MADPAVVDPYLDIFRLEFSRVIFIEFELAARLFGGVAFFIVIVFPLMWC
ncbi:hypothetical protein A628_03846 [Salmonella enterica subsp. enterica serovar Cubana str. 76814]|uniref:Uncharacterized protein n=1 Tax=Salmonella enterica subsp. enterica serovar Cubana str. 76814 TaxID=1192560 RepID=V7IMT7_SALET|nr:hypothetical protein A628_03846 [Salmonella enterica subsp. enterica serovar Cubana str. 76814]